VRRAERGEIQGHFPHLIHPRGGLLSIRIIEINDIVQSVSFSEVRKMLGWRFGLIRVTVIIKMCGALEGWEDWE
jgi:hypothetical protein